MRVVFVAPFGLRHKSTVWARILPLARVLTQRGWNPTILVPAWDSPADAHARWTDSGVEMLHVGLGGGLPGIALALLRELKRRNPHVVHIVKPRAYAGLVQWLLWQPRALRPRQRILLDIDDWEQAWAPVNHYPPAVAQALAWQEEWGIRHADAITAASHWLVERAHSYAKDTPVLFLPNGVQALPAAAARAGSAPDSPPTVLYFTRFVEVQPAWLADMAQALLSFMPLCRLVVAGRPLLAGGDLPFRAAFAARNLADPEQVVWLRDLEPPSLPGVYAAATVSIFPAQDVPLQQAKCSVRLATTLLNGVPVVASAVGEQAHYGAGGAADLVPPNASPMEFARAVARLLDDPLRRMAAIAAARSHLARNYRWEDLGESLDSYYRCQIAT